MRLDLLARSMHRTKLCHLVEKAMAKLNLARLCLSLAQLDLAPRQEPLAVLKLKPFEPLLKLNPRG